MPLGDDRGVSSPAALAVSGRGIFKTYHQGADVIRALRGVDIEVREGEFVAITGASGSGKSTLLHVLGGLDRPDDGRVEVDGHDLSRLSDEDLAQLRRRRLGFVLQFFNLLPTLNARENVAFPLLLDAAPDALERAAATLDDVGLADRGDHRPAQLSGGEQQRVALARALVGEPAVVMADEPTGNLDSATGSEILSLLRRTADRGQTIVLVTHDDSIAGFSDRTVHLTDGVLVDVEGRRS